MSVATLRSAMGGQGWLKRLGYFSFAFFLIKGLLWLAAGFAFYWLV